MDAVIASQRVGAKRRPMTGSAKQSSFAETKLDCFVAALLAMTATPSSFPGLFQLSTLLHARTQNVDARDQPGHDVSLTAVNELYAWLDTALPSAAWAAARRAIGTR